MSHATPNPPSVVCANGQCANSPATAANLQSPSADDPCVAFTMASKDALLNAPRKVFAHYLDFFILSMDNKPAASDYYNAWLQPNGEGNKWLKVGGFLRSRPIAVTPAPASIDFRQRNMEIEIRTAISRGITGFTFDTQSLTDIQPGKNLDKMLSAAAAVDSRFKIVLMPDHLSISDVAALVKAAYSHPAIYRYYSKVVVAPFGASIHTPQEWASMKASLAAQNLPIYFVPNVAISAANVAAWAGVADGFAAWPTAIPGLGSFEAANVKLVHAAGRTYMAGVAPQDYRPKSFIYWENEGSLTYRNGWMAEVQGQPDWVQIATWNDFSETTQIQPFTDARGYSGSGFFNLTGYYASWYATGKQPAITHDVIYYFYRRQSVHAVAHKATQPTVNAITKSTVGVDAIELVGFLKAPGTLSVTAGGRTYSENVGAGVQSMTVPFEAGNPSFSLTRNGTVVASVVGEQTIVPSAVGLPGGYPDFTYWSGSASSSGVCSVNGALK